MKGGYMKMITDDFNNPYNNGAQPEFFDLSIHTESPSGFIISIEDFNKQMTSGIIEKEDYIEPVFGEHLKEAKEILKGLFRRNR